MSSEAAASLAENAPDAEIPASAEIVDANAEQAPEPAAPVSIPRHPLVPVLAIGLPLLAFGIFGFGGEGLIAAIAAGVLTILAAIDIEHRMLPNRIVLPSTALLLALQLAFFPEHALEWALAGLAAAAFLGLPLIFRRDAMGMGDIKLALLLGTIVGWQVFGAIVIGCFAMLPFALVMRLRDGSIRGATLPFGPFLAFGTLLVLFAGGS